MLKEGHSAVNINSPLKLKRAIDCIPSQHKHVKYGFFNNYREAIILINSSLTQRDSHEIATDHDSPLHNQCSICLNMDVPL